MTTDDFIPTPADEQEIFNRLFAEPVPACTGRDTCPDCAEIDAIFEAAAND